MEDGPFSTPEFSSFAEDVVLLVRNTASPDAATPPTTAIEADPTPCSGVCILDTDGKVIARPGRTVAEFTTAHRMCLELTKLRGIEEPRLPATEKRLFLLELRLGLVDADHIEARAALLELDEAERATVRQACTTRDVFRLLRRVHEIGPRKTAEQIASLASASLEPDETMLEPFWAQTLMHAAATRDRALAKRAFDRLAGLQKEHPGSERSLAPLRRLLDEASR